MQRASNNYHLCLREILPVLDFKVISRNLDCFGKCMTEYTDLNFSTVSLADHLLLPAVFLRAFLWQHSQQPRRRRSSIRKALSVNTPGPTLQPKWAGGCMPRQSLQTIRGCSTDPSLEIFWSILSSSAETSHARKPQYYSHIINSYFPAPPYPGTHSSVEGQCPPSALVTDWSHTCEPLSALVYL